MVATVRPANQPRQHATPRRHGWSRSRPTDEYPTRHFHPLHDPSTPMIARLVDTAGRDGPTTPREVASQLQSGGFFWLDLETLRKWVRQTEVDGGSRPGEISEESAGLRKLPAPAAPARATPASSARPPSPLRGMALASGPIARSKTGEHDPPFRSQCHSATRALPHATAMAKPPVVDPPEPKHSSWRVWTPVTLTSTVFGLRTLTLKVRRVRPSPSSTMPAPKFGGNLASSPIVAWNRRALCSSLYAGKAVGSPTLQ
jgi:hypothetical protein